MVKYGYGTCATTNSMEVKHYTIFELSVCEDFCAPPYKCARALLIFIKVARASTIYQVPALSKRTNNNNINIDITYYFQYLAIRFAFGEKEIFNKNELPNT